MSDLTNYTEEALEKACFQGDASPFPATLHFALFTAAPGEAGGGTEVSGGSYARVAVARNDTEFPDASPIENANAVTFAEPTADWGTVTHVGIFDAATSGNLLVYKALPASRVISTGTVASIGAGAFTFKFD